MRTLLRYGASINRSNIFGNTPLHSAEQNGKVLAAQELLLHGAQIDTKSYMLQTALHLATENGHLDVLKLLLNMGATIQNNAFGMTPLKAALDAYALHEDASTQKKIKDGIRYLVFFGLPRSDTDKDKLDALFGNEWLSWQPEKRKIKEILVPYLGIEALEELTTEFAMPRYIERKRTAEEPLQAVGAKKQRMQ